VLLFSILSTFLLAAPKALWSRGGRKAVWARPG